MLVVIISTHGIAMPKGLYFTAVVFFLFLSSSFFFSPNHLCGHRTDLNRNWTHIHLRLLFEKFGRNSPVRLLPMG